MALFEVCKRVPLDHWVSCQGKMIRGLQDLDMTKLDGYSLTGEFVPSGYMARLQEGEFIVQIAREFDKAPAFAWIFEARGGEAVWIDDEEMDDGFLRTHPNLSEDETQAAHNNLIYRCALYAHAMLDERARSAKHAKPKPSAT